MCHIRFHHSLDNLLVICCQCIQWFNPFIYLLSDSLHDIHEYQVDHALLQTKTVDSNDYKMLLISKATGYDKRLAFANSFNRSNLRYRLSMMAAYPSSRWCLTKFAVLFPMMAVAILMMARPQEYSENSVSPDLSVNSDDSEHSDFSDYSESSEYSESSDYSENSEHSENSDNSKNSPAPTVTSAVEGSTDAFYQPPQFPGGTDALRSYIASHINPSAEFPDGTRVYVKASISVKGEVVDAILMRPTDSPEADAELLNTIKGMPRWIPGRERGVPVATTYIIPVSF